MQSELDPGAPAVRLQGRSKAEHDRFIQVTELDDEQRELNSTDSVQDLMQSHAPGGWRGKRWWQRPAPAVWRLCAMIADGVLLVVLLALVLALAAPLHLQFQVPNGPFGIRDA